MLAAMPRAPRNPMKGNEGNLSQLLINQNTQI